MGLIITILGTVIGAGIGIVFDKRKLPIVPVWLALFGCLGGWFLARSIFTIPPASVGVVYHPLRGGIQKNTTIGEGINFVSPFTEKEVFITQTQEYTMSHATNEGDVKGDDSIICQTNEGLKVKLDITVLYHVDPVRAPELWANMAPDFASIKAVFIRPFIRREIRQVVSRYSIVDVYSGHRLVIQKEITDNLKPVFDEYGIVLEDVKLRDVNYENTDFANAIADKQKAQQRVQTERRNYSAALNERDAKINEAKGQYESMLMKATALKQNPKLVQYEMAQKLGPKVTKIYMPVPTFGTGK